jgi:lipoate-protein ligase A
VPVPASDRSRSSGELEIGAYVHDEEVGAAVRGGSTGRVEVLRPSGTCVVLGRGSKPEVELRVDACRADGVPVLRRRGGGCAVVLDPQNLIVVVAVPTEGFGRTDRIFDRLSRWFISGLAELGVDGIYQDGTSDLVHEDRKVGGSCLYRPRGLVLYSATLLVAADLDRVERYLPHPPREPKYRRGRRHADFMANLGEVTGRSDAAQWRDPLREVLRADLAQAALAK